MLMHEDVRAKNGLLLLAKGQEVTDSAIARLKSFAQTIGIVEPLRVVAHGSAQTEVDHDPRLPAHTVGESVLR
jgi:hypothetical protein